MKVPSPAGSKSLVQFQNLKLTGLKEYREWFHAKLLHANTDALRIENTDRWDLSQCLDSIGPLDRSGSSPDSCGAYRRSLELVNGCPMWDPESRDQHRFPGKMDYIIYIQGLLWLPRAAHMFAPYFANVIYQPISS